MKCGSIKEIYVKYEHYMSPIALLSGFIWDNLTLRRIDLWVENLIMIIYLVVVGGGILFLNAYYSCRLRGRIFEKFMYPMLFLLQFGFGGLFSAFFIFYSRSASFIVSWPFLLVLVFLLIGNEFFRERYLRLTFQISIFFVALYSYSIFAVPILVGKMGADIFILSGVVSLILIGLFILILFRLTPGKVGQSRSLILVSIGSIYLLSHIFYFTNLIPPIPLSLKGDGIYHYIERTANGQYFVQYEPAPWYLPFKEFNSVFHWTPGTPVYYYSAVFAPTKLNMVILHRWSYFDEEKDEWIETDRIRYSIFGGRDGGYRGYTFKKNIAPGEWRVDVMTERDQILGRTNFEIVQADSVPKLEEDLH